MLYNKIKSKLSNPVILISIFVIICCCYGFMITHPTFSVDDTAFNIYYDNKFLLLQGRFTGILIDTLFGLYNFSPVILDLMGIVFMVIAGLTIVHIFEEILEKELSEFATIIFVGLFISFPLISEIYVYMIITMSVGLGYLFVALSIYSLSLRKLKYRNILSVLFLCLALGAYESFATVYIAVVFMICVVRCERNEIKEIKSLIKEGIKYVVVLIAAVVLRSAICNVLVILFKIDGANYAANSIVWLENNFLDTLINLVTMNAYYYVTMIFENLSIFIIGVTYLITFGLIVIYLIKKPLVSLCQLGILASPFLLSILQGDYLVYRTGQAFAVIVAFEMVYLLYKAKHKCILSCILVTLLIWQVKDLNQWFYIDYLRANEEERVLMTIAHDLEKNYDYSNKTLYFVGSYGLSDNLKSQIERTDKSLHCKLMKMKDDNYRYEDCTKTSIQQTTVYSFINWAKNAFGNCEQLEYYYYLNGYDFNIEKYNAQLDKSVLSELSAYPKTGYIYEEKDSIYIILNK